MRKIQALIDQLPDDEVAVYEDEVDIQLNPKIGADWMVSSPQKQVLTPGNNVKRYLAGALDVRTVAAARYGQTRTCMRLILPVLDATLTEHSVILLNNDDPSRWMFA